jgi:hypothetical protein
MIEILQVQTVNAAEISLGLFEIGAIISQVVILCGLYFVLKYSIKENKTSIATLKDDNETSVKDLKEKLIEAKTKKEAMKAEFKLEIEKKDMLTHKRIDAIRTDFKDHQVSSNNEFKVLNGNMSEIKGMLNLLVNRKD